MKNKFKRRKKKREIDDERYKKVQILVKKLGYLIY